LGKFGCIHYGDKSADSAFRPPSITSAASGGNEAKENGLNQLELDEASRKRAEARYLNFYEIHNDYDIPDAEGQASFH
jgi:pre-mRNA-processing factor 39